MSLESLVIISMIALFTVSFGMIIGDLISKMVSE